MDRAGRLVVPKAIRVRLGLREGSQLLAREDRGRLVLEPIAEEAVPVEVDGLLVIRGRLVGEIPDHRELRDQRITTLSAAGRRRQ
ncbi:MAG: AbrB/MazE/SpoVT family DNA-binding domain-containing protein [Deltaproteobacteria bacterium]|nr:AbrB/MazE/SpoVT family DNA-binding domain-containing protein [Deltaproteobacteria bacterium]